jgi:cytoskeleton protein RodZ
VDVGKELRQARERRGMSLQQLSRTTKISPRVLQIVETSDERSLPARVFTRAFVKSYAIEVGLDPDDTVRRYFEQFVVAPPDTPAEPEGMPAPEPVDVPDEAPRPSVARVLRGRFGTATVLVLVGIAIFALAANRDNSSRAVTPAAAAATTAAASPQSATVGTSGSAPAVSDPLHVAIAPTGPCWVQATLNDTPLFGALLNAGDRRMVDAPSDLTLRVGDPATFAFTINGKPARIAGVPGHAVTVRITRDNYAQFF